MTEHDIAGRPISSMKSVLEDAVSLAGGQRAWSRKTGINQADVSQALNGKKDPMPESIINALGYVTQTVCIPMRGQNR